MNNYIQRNDMNETGVKQMDITMRVQCISEFVPVKYRRLSRRGNEMKWNEMKDDRLRFQFLPDRYINR